MRLPAPALVPTLVLVASALAGCGASTPTAAVAPHAGLEVRSLTGLGPALATTAGSTLYIFVPDHDQRVTCTGACAATWPPLASDGLPSVGAGVQAALVGTDPDPAGGRVATYDGWPLYTFAGDLAPGQDNGQGLDLDGGYWYAIAPTGRPVTPGA